MDQDNSEPKRTCRRNHEKLMHVNRYFEQNRKLSLSKQQLWVGVPLNLKRE